MVTAIIFFLFGFVLLYFGAEFLVRGSKKIALGLGFSQMLVGLTIVAFGTSFPELMVSLVAAFDKETDIAIANIVGSNIANVALIVGTSAVIIPLGVTERTTRREIPFMILSGGFLYILALWGKSIGRFDGVLLLLAFLVFVVICILSEVYKRPSECRRYEEMERAKIEFNWWLECGSVVLGMVILAVGARLTVAMAVRLSNIWGIAETVVGATAVALGTSLPELFTSVVAALKKDVDISVGNIIGSNIFNSLAIVGMSSLVHPIVVKRELFTADFPVMLVVSIIILPMLKSDFLLDRKEAIFLLAIYIAYISVVFLH